LSFPLPFLDHIPLVQAPRGRRCFGRWREGR
jgi:hypothetical protein